MSYFTVLFFLVFSAVSWAQNPSPAPSSSAAEINPASDEKVEAIIVQKQKENLVKWDNETVQAQPTLNDAGEPSFKVELAGKILKAQGSVLYNYKPYKVSEDQRLKVDQYLETEHTTVKIVHIDEMGKVDFDESEITITIKDWPKAQTILRNYPKKKWNVTAGLGITSMGYTQTNSSIGNLTSLALTAKLGADYNFQKSKWSVGLLGYINAVSLSSSSATRPFRFLGVNLRGGRPFPWLNDPWEISLFGGFYYLTMLTNGTFGFADVSGPQIYPSIKYKLKNGTAINAYFKYSPITQSFSLLSLSNYEIAAGLQYHFKIKNTKCSASFDYSNVSLTTVDIIGLTTTARANSMTLGFNVFY